MVEKTVITTFKTIYDSKGMKKQIKEITDINGKFKTLSKSVKNSKGGWDNLSQSVSKTTTNVKKFNMAWLSIMFGGMAIQRTFGRIQRAAVKTFTDVMSTVEGASTNVSKLSAHFNYLKFVIGSAIDNALGPFMPMIIHLITAFADLVEQHPEAVFWAISGAFAAGTALAATGSFMLFVGGVVMLVKQIGGLQAISSALSGIANAFVGIGAGAVSLLVIVASIFFGIWIAWKENFGRIKDWANVVFLNIKEAFKGLWKFIVGFFKLFKALFSGNADDFVAALKQIASGFWTFMTSAAKALLSAIVVISLGVLRAIIGVINTAIGLFEKLLRLANSDVNLPRIPTKQTGGRIPSEGLYYLHQGEQVIPSNRTGLGGNITININGAGSPDLIAEEVLAKIQQYT